MKKCIILLILISLTNQVYSQLPYSSLEKDYSIINPNNIIARMIDGLGYRYYWASKDLDSNDLSFKPSNDSRTSLETLKHIHGLSKFILSSLGQDEVQVPTDSFDDLRSSTLLNFKKASDIIEKSDLELIAIKMRNGETLPFWNLINGPIEDAIYHTGQIVAFRRASGNPMNSQVNVLKGKNNE